MTERRRLQISGRGEKLTRKLEHRFSTSWRSTSDFGSLPHAEAPGVVTRRVWGNSGRLVGVQDAPDRFETREGAAG